ncbi:unnamed protein product [Kuraishia capsulata CBS 1993]|uniref:Uncharacterized protein n=1 Tax=Kuraishia capsulata CBS 1993 TaxID=1382522 RepID=W6MIT8_9ASCO|nr:uncharacterized protein KUCA_T00000262001 [Kuraishia capsulata CBS 1993]CDK24302.1 unnamed protein product [Kuraishia capsulata CBS 1993]
MDSNRTTFSPNEEDFYRAALLGGLYPLLVLCTKNLVFMRLENFVLSLRSEKGNFGDLVYRIYMITSASHLGWFWFFFVNIWLKFALLALLAYPQEDELDANNVTYVSWQLVTSETIFFAVSTSVMESVVYLVNLMFNVDDEIDLDHYDETLKMRSTILNSSTLSKCLEIKQRLKSATKHQQYYGSVDSETFFEDYQEVLVIDYNDTQGTSIVESSSSSQKSKGTRAGFGVDSSHSKKSRLGRSIDGDGSENPESLEVELERISEEPPSPSGLHKIPYLNGADAPSFIIDGFIIHRGDYEEHKDYFVSRLRDQWLLIWKLDRFLINMNESLLLSIYFYPTTDAITAPRLADQDKFLAFAIVSLMAVNVIHFELWRWLVNIPRILNLGPSMKENIDKCFSKFSFSSSPKNTHQGVVEYSAVGPTNELMDAQPKTTSWFETITWDYNVNLYSTLDAGLREDRITSFTDEWSDFKRRADVKLNLINLVTYTSPLANCLILVTLIEFIHHYVAI